MVRIGYQTYAWYHYREMHNVSMPLPRILAEIKDAGFNHVEISAPTEALGTAESLRQLLAETGLTLHALTGRIDGGLIDWSKNRIDILAELGGEVLMVNAGWIKPGEEKTADRYDALVAGLEELAEYGRPRGVRIAYHNHIGTICETPKEIERVAGMLRQARLCLDTGHLAAVGGNIHDVIKRHSHLIIYGHLKDAHRNLSTGVLEEFVELGTGNTGVDVPAIIKDLEAFGFDGWLMVEQDHTRTTPGDSARKNAEALRKMGIEITK